MTGTSGTGTKKAGITRAKLREEMTEKLYLSAKRGNLVEKLFDLVSKVEDPAKQAKLIMEVMSFCMPRLAAQQIEVTNEQASVTSIAVSRAEPLKSVSSKD
jgi:hypothetical protein